MSEGGCVREGGGDRVRRVKEEGEERSNSSRECFPGGGGG